MPDYASIITVQNLGLALGMVLLISAFSGYIAVRKVLNIDPYDIFRG
jgi:putative ABC transport system permease protein